MSREHSSKEDIKWPLGAILAFSAILVALFQHCS